jgi:PIN domain nuclease of toxin-antitoxin system
MSTEVLSSVLLDTHVVLWWQAESARLSNKARKCIEDATSRLVSPVTFWELAMLVEKGRVRLDRPTAAWVNDFLSTDRVVLAELTASVAVSAGELTAFHGDPADRMIVASAVAAGVALVTKDGRVRDWATTSKQLSTVW